MISPSWSDNNSARNTPVHWRGINDSPPRGSTGEGGDSSQRAEAKMPFYIDKSNGYIRD